MDLPDDVSAQLISLEGAVDVLEDYMQPFLAVTPKDIDNKLQPLERARAHMCLALALCRLYKARLQLQGQRIDGHPVTKEQERLELYQRKVGKAIGAVELAASRPSVAVNVAAANRFIDHAIPDLTPEQRQALKQVGDAAKQKQLQEAAAQQPTGVAGSKRSRGGSQQHQPRQQHRPDQLLADVDDVMAAALGGGVGGS